MKFRIVFWDVLPCKIIHILFNVYVLNPVTQTLMLAYITGAQCSVRTDMSLFCKEPKVYIVD
jgi:hypothetical protein